MSPGRHASRWTILGLLAILSGLAACGDDDADSGTAEPFVMKPLTDDDYLDSDATFDRDGFSILFSSSRDQAWNLRRLDLESGESVPVTDFQQSVRRPSISTSGRYMTAEFLAFPHPKVGLLDINGSVLSYLAKGGGPEWAPDDHQVAMILSDPLEFGFWGLAVFDLSSREVRHLETTVAASDHLAWSPDGRQICYEGLIRYDQPWYETDLYLVDASGGPSIRLTTTREATAPAWSPDGRWIAFNSGAAILALDVANGEVRTLIKAESRNRWLNPSWSRDGSRITFQSSGSRYGSDIWIGENVQTLLR